jgi:hypothetical protein
MNKDNLLKLAAFLKVLPQEEFHMHHFRQTIASVCNGTNKYTDFFSIDNCGSVGCAMGWAPFVQGLETEVADFSDCASVTLSDISSVEKTLDFNSYCKRIFGFESDHVVWDWCFASDWEDVDNTPVGAALRIEFAVEHGKEVLIPRLDEHDGYIWPSFDLMKETYGTFHLGGE